MKIKAEVFLPLVLDFAEEHLQKDDFKKLKKSLVDEEKDNLGSNYKEDLLVKNGGMKAMLACYLKNNKKVYKEFKSKYGDDLIDVKKEKTKKRAKK